MAPPSAAEQRAYKPRPPPPCPACDGDLVYRVTHWRCKACDQAVIRPQPGPQETACSSSADILIYGGAAGGGKSWHLVYEAARHTDVAGYGAYVFRRTTKQVTGAGSIWEEANDLYPQYGGTGRENKLDWTFQTDGTPATIQFGHIEHEKNKFDHQGKQYAFIGFDELTHFTETQFWYLQTRNRSKCGVRPRIRATCNPSPDSWVRGLIDWWIDDDGDPIPERSGALRWFVRGGDDGLIWADTPEAVLEQATGLGFEITDVRSLTFVPAKLEDNEILTTADPSYRATLLSMPRIERLRLLGGNWNVRASAGAFFQRSYFEVIEAPPAKVRRRVRAWDLAATKPTKANKDPDWSVGVLLSIDADGVLCVEHVERFRDGPLGVDQRLQRIAALDGVKTTVCLWQDPGQAGKSQITHYRGKLLGYRIEVERAAKDKQTYAGPASSSAEGGLIRIVRGKWNDVFLAVLEGFPPEGAGHDDDVDALSLAHLKLVRSNLERLRRLAQYASQS